MKILKVAEFGGGIGATKKGEKLVEFVNKNNIKQEDIVKITFLSTSVYTLFYYAEE
jgi:hypothetical protein